MVLGRYLGIVFALREVSERSSCEGQAFSANLGVCNDRIPKYTLSQALATMQQWGEDLTRVEAGSGPGEERHIWGSRLKDGQDCRIVCCLVY